MLASIGSLNPCYDILYIISVLVDQKNPSNVYLPLNWEPFFFYKIRIFKTLKTIETCKTKIIYNLSALLAKGMFP